MNVGDPQLAMSVVGRVSEMPVVVIEPRKGKSAASEGALLRIKFSRTLNKQN
jgi:hypothetical protein